MEWISVDDKLPEVNKRVLTCDEIGHIECAKFVNLSGRTYWLTNQDQYQLHITVTHWMPLPDLPGKDN